MSHIEHKGPVRCAVVGYGPTFSWGRMHARWIKAVADLSLTAICDTDPECAAQAQGDFPETDTYTDLREILTRDDIDLVTVVTPHNTHASIVQDCLSAGKHVVVDKPMCISIAEATAMVETAEKNDRTLAVFHNRRHDGNVRAIKRAIEQGEIGEVFYIELSSCGYGRPSHQWRSRKEISGGQLYDWGSHAIDWVLNMIPCDMAQVTGFFHKRLWSDVSNENQTQAMILFENGVVANIMQSSLARIGKPLWYILGTEGAITDSGKDAIKGYTELLNGPPGGHFRMVTSADEREVPYMESDWLSYYIDLADHLLRGAPVPVSGKDGRRVITVLETAEKSARSGKSEGPPFK